MDKFEFSDLHKFLVSAGVALIAISVLIPWFYLKEPFDLLIEKDKLKLLTIEAQNILKNRQSLIGYTYTVMPWTSFSLFITGLITTIWGVSKWSTKQANLDERDRLTTQKLVKEIANMTPSEIEQKNEQEYQEAVDVVPITTTTTSTPVKEIFIASYLDIEKHFIDKLKFYYQDMYRIQPHLQIEGERHLTPRSQYDLVMKSVWRDLADCIFEFKYYPYGVTKSTIRENLIKLNQLAITYRANFRVEVKPVLLIVLPDDKFNLSRFLPLKGLPEELSLNSELVLDFINLQDITNLNKAYFDSLIKSSN